MKTARQAMGEEVAYCDAKERYRAEGEAVDPTAHDGSHDAKRHRQDDEQREGVAPWEEALLRTVCVLSGPVGRSLTRSFPVGSCRRREFAQALGGRGKGEAEIADAAHGCRTPAAASASDEGVASTLNAPA
jgi:hypothetical protein